MILIDHSRTFATSKKACSDLIYDEKNRESPNFIMETLPRAFFDALKALTAEGARTVGRRVPDRRRDRVHHGPPRPDRRLAGQAHRRAGRGEGPLLIGRPPGRDGFTPAAEYPIILVGNSNPMNLLDAPHAKPLRIVDLAGGESVRRRLMALGFHKGDVVELDGQAILQGAASRPQLHLGHDRRPRPRRRPEDPRRGRP